MSEFKKHLPENCPPPDRKPASGDFFRLVPEVVVQPGDFDSFAETGAPCPPGSHPCQWAGVSLSSDRAGAEATKKLRGALAKMKIAKGTLTAEMGATRETPSKRNKWHVTYWPFDEAQPWLVFEVEDDSESGDGNG